MFDKLFGMENFDPNKVMEVVNLVWNNRERIMQLVERLPELLRETGESIESAGASALSASALLVGNKETPGVDDIAGLAASALERAQGEIQTVAQAMDRIGREIDDVRIPSVKAKYTDVMGYRLISGLDIGESQMVDDAAKRLKGGSDRLEEIGKDLRAVAQHLRELGTAITKAGDDLNGVGTQLKESGATLRSLMDWQ